MSLVGDLGNRVQSGGLTEQEALRRRAAGQGNTAKLKTTRSYSDILRENLFTFINIVFFSISLVMLLIGRIGDSFLVIVVIFGGVLVNIYQEVWAKRKLDQIALLSRPTATVIREGIERPIDPSEIVLGDILLAEPGDQILVDGQVVGTGRIEVDESLLTGESDLIPKMDGDRLYSGSFCVSGSACYEAESVGADTLAYKLMAGAKAFRQNLTPLQQEINLVIRVFVLIATFLWILLGISALSRSYSLNDLVQRAAVVAGLVPAGLVLAITLAYGLGSVRMLGKNVLIQQANAVESLSNVNVLCLDKTGTLTTNEITLQEVYPLLYDEAQVRSLLSTFAASLSTQNRTSEAIALACPGEPHPLIDEVPFSSVHKWSGLVLDSTKEIFSSPKAIAGTLILGAPDVLAEAIYLSSEAIEVIQQGAKAGFRMVLFAQSHHATTLHDEQDQIRLPDDLTPIAILRFSEKLRPEARETLEGFTRAGIAIKIISGDYPSTVAALAQQIGLGADLPVISGQELAKLDEAQFAQVARSHMIFGRVTPEQKARLVRSLRQAGYYVAMTGDGVNDILSLKQASLAIAMESGSKATRGVADIVLLKDSFGALPQTFLEGQCIRNGIQDVLKLFMVRTFCVTLLIFATAIVTDDFPLANKQSAVVTLVGVGFPSMFLPIWAKPGIPAQRSIVRSILHFVVPATLTLTLVALLVYLFYLLIAILELPPGADLTQVDYNIPRSALVTILVLGNLLLMPFLKPPTTAWVGGEPLSGDYRYSIVALLLLGLYLLIVAVPFLRHFFELSPLGTPHYLFIGLIAIEWSLILRLVWRTRFLDRFLGVDLS